jgi:Tfp pilus assembly protein PilX
MPKKNSMAVLTLIARHGNRWCNNRRRGCRNRRSHQVAQEDAELGA